MTPKQFVKLYKKHGSVKAVWRMSSPGLTWGAVRKIYLTAISEDLMQKQSVGRKNRDEQKAPVIRGQVKATKTLTLPVPKSGVSRYILTCAQNNTKLHEPLWRNLLVLAEHYNARLHVARFLYNKTGLGALNDKAQLGYSQRQPEDVSWEAAITPYLSDERLEIAPGLVWCGEMNILPTAERPLSGLEVYTGRRSGIFPHVKIAMDSVASARSEPTKFNYTTGTVTLRNYIKRKAGFKAEFHHCYGALLVEVDSDGDWFCRQLNADSDGTIHDLDIRVKNGTVEKGNFVEGITWGDIHLAEAEPWVHALAFDNGGILDQLRPRHTFYHDVISFRGRSHHELKNPHILFKRHLEGQTDIAEELREAGHFLRRVHRPWCKTVVVGSNHHRHIGRWLQEQDGQRDPINAQFWLKLQTRIFDQIARGSTDIDYLLSGLQVADPKPLAPAIFIHENSGFVICPDEHGGIECGQHGDLGPNGARGNRKVFARMGRRTNIAHSHSAGIDDGAWQAGTFGTLQPDWTQGPSSWSHSLTVTYENGKRAIVTLWNNKWRA